MSVTHAARGLKSVARLLSHPNSPRLRAAEDAGAAASADLEEVRAELAQREKLLKSQQGQIDAQQLQIKAQQQALVNQQADQERQSAEMRDLKEALTNTQEAAATQVGALERELGATKELLEGTTIELSRAEEELQSQAAECLRISVEREEQCALRSRCEGELETHRVTAESMESSFGEMLVSFQREHNALIQEKQRAAEVAAERQARAAQRAKKSESRAEALGARVHALTEETAALLGVNASLRKVVDGLRDQLEQADKRGGEDRVRSRKGPEIIRTRAHVHFY